MRPRRAPGAEASGDAGAAWWSLAAEDLLARLDSSPQGLSALEAGRRIAQTGPNTVEDAPGLAPLRLLARQFASPLVLILFLGAVVSLVLRDWIEAGIILVILLGSSLLGFAQEHRASRAMAALQHRLALMVQVRRAGRLATAPASGLVPGDVVELSAGDLVPADGVLLEARDFLVVESALTGESLPVEKTPGAVPADSPLAARLNCVFLGTSVRSGWARMLVARTGRGTTMGAIAGRLADTPTETEFTRGVRRFGTLLLQVMLVMVVFVLVVNQWLGRPPFESLLFAVALAVGLSPELLPAIVSVTLSRGARAMAARGVLVRRLDAIENLGAMTVLCTDKTGTLTAGTMVLEAAVDADGQPCARVAELAFLNAALETGIANPLDAAIVEAGRRDGRTPQGWTKVDEIPYDFQRRRLTIVAHEGDAAGHLLITKGAFASITEVCTTVAIPGEGEAPLDAERREALEEWFRRRGGEGCRVLAVASRRMPEQSRYGRADEHGLRLDGFLLFRDPPKPGIADTLRALGALGIRIKMVTGDNRHVAAHVAHAVGLDATALLTGAEIAAMRDEALWQRAEATDLFVEVDPQQKERIVRALQRRGHAVGVLGDGINDAPALRAADVGVSVDGAVDVARESADVILLQPDLDVLRAGVADGRRTFANTLKYIGITTSANFGNMVSMAVAAPLLPFLPLAPKQVLLNNFLSDIPAIAISTDNVDPQHTTAAQRWDLRAVRRFMLVFGLLSTVFDLLTFQLLLRLFDADQGEFRTAWFMVSLLTELAVVLVLRTSGPWWRSRPSAALLGSTITVGALALVLPWLHPVASLFGFVPLPAQLMGALLLIALTYLAATEMTKRWFFRTGPAVTRASA
jgi:Mg2+-importing ATPase